MPKISIIVPVYNVEKYIHRCLDSILNQTFADFDLVLIDDGSPDNSGTICDKYAENDDRIHVIHQKNSGQATARNKGLDWAFENSDSEWIAFIDSDDCVHKCYLEILYNTVIKYDVKISSCAYAIFKDKEIEDGIIAEYKVDIAKPDDLLKKNYEYSEYNYTVVWGRLYSKELLKTERFPDGKYFEDEYFTYRVIYSCDKVAVIREVLYYYFKNNNGTMASVLTPKRMKDYLDAYRNQIDFFYDKKCRYSFGFAFKVFCKSRKRHYEKYKANKEYKLLLKAYKKDIKRFLKSYHDYLPELVLKYGYSKWVSGKALKLDVLKCDYNNIRKEKGFIRAVIWAIKNGISVYFGG